MAQTEEYVQGDAQGFASEMKKLINSKEMSDIRFVIGPNRKTIYAHRCILAARCEVFRVMFSEQASAKGKDGGGDVPFVMSDILPEVFLPMIEYIYTNCVTLTSKNCVDVLGSAMEYGLDGLRQTCVDYMERSLSDSTACEALQAGVTYSQDQLRESALKYIAEHTKQVFETKGFHELSDTSLVCVLKSDNLDMDEVDLLAAIREWATVNSVVLGKPVSQVARRVTGHIRLPLLSPQELRTVEEENKDSKLLSVEHFAFAWKCHALRQMDKNNPLTTPRRGTKSRDSHKSMKTL